MKRTLFNKFLVALALMVSTAGCLKDKGYDQGLYGAVRNTEGKKFVSVGLGGIQNLSKSSIIVNSAADSSFTVDITINLDYGQTTTEPQPVKIAIDNAKITTYNTANGKNFQPVTAEMVKLASTDLVIPPGASNVTTKMTINQKKFDPAVSYLIPISIVDAPGASLSSNLNTRYYNVIGNPLSGNYTMTGMRYNYTGSVSWTGPPAPIPANYTATTAYSGTILASAVDAQTIQIVMGNIPDPVSGSAYYFITANSNFSSISYDFAKTFNEGYSNIQKFVVDYKPATPTTKASFRLITKYNNTTGNAGNDRLVDQTFTHQ